MAEIDPERLTSVLAAHVSVLTERRRRHALELANSVVFPRETMFMMTATILVLGDVMARWSADPSLAGCWKIIANLERASAVAARMQLPIGYYGATNLANDEARQAVSGILVRWAQGDAIEPPIGADAEARAS